MDILSHSKKHAAIRSLILAWMQEKSIHSTEELYHYLHSLHLDELMKLEKKWTLSSPITTNTTTTTATTISTKSVQSIPWLKHLSQTQLDSIVSHALSLKQEEKQLQPDHHSHHHRGPSEGVLRKILQDRISRIFHPVIFTHDHPRYGKLWFARRWNSDFTGLVYTVAPKVPAASSYHSSRKRGGRSSYSPVTCVRRRITRFDHDTGKPSIFTIQMDLTMKMGKDLNAIHALGRAAHKAFVQLTESLPVDAVNSTMSLGQVEKIVEKLIQTKTVDNTNQRVLKLLHVYTKAMQKCDTDMYVQNMIVDHFHFWSSSSNPKKQELLSQMLLLSTSSSKTRTTPSTTVMTIQEASSARLIPVPKVMDLMKKNPHSHHHHTFPTDTGLVMV